MASTILPRFGGMNKSMIIVTAATGSEVTCSNGTVTKTAKEKDGTWTFRGLDPGEWTVIATLDGSTMSKEVTISKLIVEYVNLIEFSIVENGVPYYEAKARSAPFYAGYPSNNMQVSQQDGYILAKGTQAGCGMAYFENVDLTGISVISLSGEFDVSSTESDLCVFAVWSSLGTYLADNRVATTKLTATGATLDVSGLSGEYIVGLTSIYTHENKIVELLAKAG